MFFFFSSRRRHTRCYRDWSSDVCSSDLLSRPEPIQVHEIEIGRHGLLISERGRRGLLLPQVPVERGWDATTFLEQTCRKAGLPLDAWRAGATIEAFTAEIFSDKKMLTPDPARLDPMR